MNKRIIFTMTLAAFALIIFFLFTKKEGKPVAVPKDDDTVEVEKPEVPAKTIVSLFDDVHIVSDDFKIEETDKQITEKENATDTTFTFDVFKRKSFGELQLTIREIDNGDKFVFSKFVNTDSKGTSLPFKIVFNDQSSYDFYEFQEEIPQEHDRVFGIDYTTNMKGVYTLKGEEPYQLYLSQNYISDELVETYDDGAKSVLRELINEDQYIDIFDKNDMLTFNLKLRTTAENQISENWFLLSKEKLFETEEEMTFYKNSTNDNFISSPKWQTATGNYTKLPWSIEPGTKVGYGRNLVSLQGKVFAGRYNNTQDRFYYDMLVNSVNYLFDFKQDAPLWQTEYTSTWLKREYGITAPYTDTRHNENIALFLSNAGTILNNEDIKQSDLLYADFLSTQEEIKNILATDNGYYVLDYYSEKQTKKTHVSLNHALGEMNFLLETYTKTNDEKYLNTALKIKQAVEDTGTMWINNSNGDLWYQINGDYSFEGKDYDVLTLEDLVTSIGKYEDMQLPYNKEIYKALINSKIRFLMADNVPMPRILYNNLMENGFAELIEDYAHVFSY